MLKLGILTVQKANSSAFIKTTYHVQQIDSVF